MDSVRKAAVWNGIELVEKEMDIPNKLETSHTPSNSKDADAESTLSPGLGSSEDKPQPPSKGFMAIMAHPLLRRWSLNLYFNWSVNAMVYYTLSLSASNLGEGMSIYHSFMLLAAIEIPFIIAISYIMQKWGRRIPLSATMIGAGIFCLIPLSLPQHSPAIIVMGILGKGCIAASFALVYFFSAEIYPTVLRSTGIGLCSTFARIGGFLAPYVGATRFLGNSTPLLICGVVSLTAGFLALDFPETLHKTLPQTLDDVNKLKAHQAREFIK